MKPMLAFFKLFVWAEGLDDPSVGGFGSTLLLYLVQFGIQSRPDIRDLGSMLLYLLDVIAHRLNYYTVGISTVNGGSLFPKFSVGLDDSAALVFMDPQDHSHTIGDNTSRIKLLAKSCSRALKRLYAYDYRKVSAIASFLPDTRQILGIRIALMVYAAALRRSPWDFFPVIDPSILKKKKRNKRRR